MDEPKSSRGLPSSAAFTVPAARHGSTSTSRRGRMSSCSDRPGHGRRVRRRPRQARRLDPPQPVRRRPHTGRAGPGHSDCWQRGEPGERGLPWAITVEVALAMRAIVGLDGNGARRGCWGAVAAEGAAEHHPDLDTSISDVVESRTKHKYVDLLDIC